MFKNSIILLYRVVLCTKQRSYAEQEKQRNYNAAHLHQSWTWRWSTVQKVSPNAI